MDNVYTTRSVDSAKFDVTGAVHVMHQVYLQSQDE
jgi:hypothetical protein